MTIYTRGQPIKGRAARSSEEPVAPEPDDDAARVHTQALAVAIAAVRRQLERGKARSAPAEPFPSLPEGSALARVVAAFGLSPFETGILVLAAGVELDPDIGRACAAVHGDPSRPWASFGVALSALSSPRWDALGEDAALRSHRLIVLGEGHVLTQRPLYLDERVLHALMGRDALDQRVARRAHAVAGDLQLAAAHERMVPRIAHWARERADVLVQLCAEQPRAAVQLAARTWHHLGKRALLLSAADVPLDPAEREELRHLCEREARLAELGYVIELDGADRVQARAAAVFASRLRAPQLLVGREVATVPTRSVVSVRIAEPTFADAVALWRRALGDRDEPSDAELGVLAAQFRLDAAAVHAAVSHLSVEREAGSAARVLWSAARAQARPRLEDLAQRIHPSATFASLVLPESQMRVLRALVGQVRHKARVQHHWGLAALGERGQGTSAIFAGPSGTGKTMGAEAVACELDLDLFRIDLSAVVSKYIGETEENLRRVFDAAESGGAILLFDEADALFGKRTEVRDSHDRHANIEVSYLLQRMEAYGGLSILTTNLRKAIDDAFLRRVQFVLELQFPDQALRERIWQGIFPPGVPLGALDFRRLAQLTVAGGNIRSIARNATYLAAGDDDGDRVEMRHVLEAARLEYVKLSRALPPSEVKGWLE